MNTKIGMALLVSALLAGKSTNAIGQTNAEKPVPQKIHRQSTQYVINRKVPAQTTERSGLWTIDKELLPIVAPQQPTAANVTVTLVSPIAPMPQSEMRKVMQVAGFRPASVYELYALGSIFGKVLGKPVATLFGNDNDGKILLGTFTKNKTPASYERKSVKRVLWVAHESPMVLPTDRLAFVDLSQR